jgi:hypothetical protein
MGSSRIQDGTNQCERIGIQISRQDPMFFGGVTGYGPLNPSVTAVARHTPGNALEKVANLVILDPVGCVAVSVGGSSGAQVLVGTATNPGSIAVDSDGTGATCTGGKDTLSANGSGTELYAEPTTGSTPGQILLQALPGDASSCTGDACNPANVPGQVAPQPISEQTRVTRSVVDYTYNCHTAAYGNYDGILPISGCDNGTADYVDSLISQVETDSGGPASAGFTVLGNKDCNPSASVTYTGNYWISCGGSGYKVGGGGGSVAVTFNGNVVFDTSVSVQAGGSLSFNSANPNSGTLPASCETSVCLTTSSSDASIVYLNGSITTTGTGSLDFNNTFTYITSGVNSSISKDPTNYA